MVWGEKVWKEKREGKGFSGWGEGGGRRRRRRGRGGGGGGMVS